MATLTLRTLTNAGDTTKGAPLTNAEIDQNFVALKADVILAAPLASPTFTGTVVIPGGTVNSTTIGATTRSTGAFTTLAANGAVTFTAGTASTSTTTGSLVVTGGVGVSGRLTANDIIADGVGLTNLNANNFGSGTLTVARGGTNSAAAPTAGAISYGTGAAYGFSAAGTLGQALVSGGTNSPTWVTLAASATTDMTNVANAASGTLAIARGGSGGSATPTAGAIAFGTGTAYSFNTAGTLGQALVSGGAGTPTWVTLSASATTDMTNLSNAASGTVAVARGGTNSAATPSAGALAYGTGTAYAFTAVGTSGQALISAGAAAPVWQDLPSGVTVAGSDTASTVYPIFATGTGSLTTAYIDNTTSALAYVPNTGTLTAVVFSGSGASLTNLNAANLASGTISGDRGVSAGSASASFVEYNGTTKTAGQFDGGVVAPDGTTRLNYSGYFYATRFYGDGSNLTSLAAANLAGTIPTGVLGASTVYIGTTAVALNRGTGALALTGVSLPALTLGNYMTGTSYDGSGAITAAVNATSANTGSTVVARDASGNFTAGVVTVTDLNTTSDRALKTNFKQINSPGIVPALRPVKFDWIDSGRSSYGLIAQEVESILPELVTTTDGVKTVAYIPLIAILIDAVQRLEARVAQLESR